MMLALSNRKTGPGLTVTVTAAGSGSSASGEAGGLAPGDQDRNGAAIAAEPVEGRKQPLIIGAGLGQQPRRARRGLLAVGPQHRGALQRLLDIVLLAGYDELDRIGLRLADDILVFFLSIFAEQLDFKEFERIRPDWCEQC